MTTNPSCQQTMFSEPVLSCDEVHAVRAAEHAVESSAVRQMPVVGRDHGRGLFDPCLRVVLATALVLGFLWQTRRMLAGRPEARMRTLLRTSLYCRRSLRLLGIRVRVAGRALDQALVIGNHLGWLDPLVIAGHRPSLMVTSREVEARGLMGRICSAAGCAFVERRRARAVPEDQALLAGLLADCRMVIFPESTSTDGRMVRPFRSGLMGVAAQAGVPLQPLAVSFPRVAGRPFGDRVRDAVCWYGDMTLLPSLWRIFTAGRVEARLDYLEPLYAATAMERKALAVLAHAAVSAAYRQAVPFAAGDCVAA